MCGHVYLTFMQDAIYAPTLGPARFNLLFAFESDSYILAIIIYKQKRKKKATSPHAASPIGSSRSELTKKVVHRCVG